MRVVIETFILASRERVFDLARDVGAHVRTSHSTRERVVPPGKIAGLLEVGDLVTFEGVHLGVRQRLTAQVTQMVRPLRFVDEQVRGAFRSFQHLHEFEERDGGTLMRDSIEWQSPLGLLGRFADRLFIGRHLQAFISTKQQELKQLAEAAHDPG